MLLRFFYSFCKDREIKGNKKIRGMFTVYYIKCLAFNEFQSATKKFQGINIKHTLTVTYLYNNMFVIDFNGYGLGFL